MQDNEQQVQARSVDNVKALLGFTMDSLSERHLKSKHCQSEHEINMSPVDSVSYEVAYLPSQKHLLAFKTNEHSQSNNKLNLSLPSLIDDTCNMTNSNSPDPATDDSIILDIRSIQFLCQYIDSYNPIKQS